MVVASVLSSPPLQVLVEEKVLAHKFHLSLQLACRSTTRSVVANVAQVNCR